MSATLSGHSKASSAAGVTSLTTASLTLSGSNLVAYALVGSAAGTPVAPSAVKWGGSGGATLTQLDSTRTPDNTGSGLSAARASIWRKIAPTAQSSTGYCSFSSSQDECHLIFWGFSGVDQTTPNNTIGYTQSTSNGSTAPTATAASTTSGNTVTGCYFGVEYGDSDYTTTPAQTSIEEIEGAATGFESSAAAYTTASGSSTVINYTITGAQYWSAWAFELNDASSGVTASPPSQTVTFTAQAATASGQASAAPPSKTITFTAQSQAAGGAASTSVPSQTITFSAQAPVASGEGAGSPAAQTVTFTAQVPAATGAANTTAPIQTITFTAQTPIGSGEGATPAASQTVTFTAQAQTAGGEASCSAPSQTITFSAQTPIATGDSGTATASPPSQTITFTAPVPSASGAASTAAPSQTVTFTAQSQSAGGSASASPPSQTVTFTAQAPSAVGAAAASPSVVTITFTARAPLTTGDPVAGNAKHIGIFYETGATVYAAIRRAADDYLMDDANGSFAAAPTDFFLTVPEDSILKGLYEVSEARAAWDDGEYNVFFYRQLGGSPVPVSDVPVHEMTMHLANDEIIDDGATATLDSSQNAYLRSLRKAISDIFKQLDDQDGVLKKILAAEQDHELRLRRATVAPGNSKNPGPFRG